MEKEHRAWSMEHRAYHNREMALRTTHYALCSKKAVNQVGVAIIAMAILLLLGALFTDDSNPNSKTNYLKDKSNNSLGYPDENYIFYLNNTDIGRQKKVTENFPNIELGSKMEYNTIYIGNNFRLNANPFTTTPYSFEINLDKPDEINELLIYFKSDKLSGDNPVDVSVNGQHILRTQANSGDSPIKIQNKKLNETDTIAFEILKPNWYDLFNWNKIDITDLRIVEMRQNKNNNLKTFNFQVDKENIERAYIDLLVSCDEVVETSDAIVIRVNGYIIANNNPKCTSKNNLISATIPLNILMVDKNTLELETTGYYKVAYSINKIYYNDKQTYKFTINNFNDIIDVIMYGDFDKDNVDLRLNNVTMTLNTDEIKSIIPYLRYGTNQIQFLTKPLSIEEFVIEKNQYIY